MRKFADLDTRCGARLACAGRTQKRYCKGVSALRWNTDTFVACSTLFVAVTNASSVSSDASYESRRLFQSLSLLQIISGGRQSYSNGWEGCVQRKRSCVSVSLNADDIVFVYVICSVSCSL